MTVSAEDTLPLLAPGAAILSPDLGSARSELLFERQRSDAAPSRVTIAVPTYNRPQLLRETLQSVWAQQGFDAYELIIVDNASTPENVENVLTFLKSVDHPVRYYLNSENVGAARNWNWCLTLARSTWVSILNDDDLLKPCFLARMMPQVEGDPEVDAIICQPEILDQRSPDVRKSEIRATVRRGLLLAFRFRGFSRTRMTARRLFWSNIAGNSLGALYRRDVVLALGGFDPREAPNSDYVVNVRLALRGRFFQVRAVLALLRFQVNDSMNPNTIKGVLLTNFRLRNRLIAEGLVPGSWAHWPRRLLAHELGVEKAHWKQAPDRAEIARQAGVDMPANARWIYLVRMLRGGI